MAKNVCYVSLFWMNFDCWQLFCKEQRFAEDQSVCVRVFTVLYDYDPYQSSPNDQPDTELPLTAGEHVYITGDIDEVSDTGTWCDMQ